VLTVQWLAIVVDTIQYLREKTPLNSWPTELIGLGDGGVLLAHGFQDAYGGSVLSGNTSKTVLGMELAAAAAALAIAMVIGAALLESCSKE